jgi:hypothetical protein
MKRLMTLIAVTLSLMTCYACSAQTGTRTVVVAEGAKAVPDSTLQDWVTYGDHLVELRVVAESREPAPKEEIDRGEGLIGRRVTLELGSPKWTRPTFTRAAKLPATLTVDSGGWVFHGTEETRLRVSGEPWMEVGQTYLGAVAYGAIGDKPSWFILSSALLANGTVQLEKGDQPTQALSALAGKTTTEIAQLLTATRADPAARKYMTEDPVKRWNDLARDRGGSKPDPVESP